jgi:targeting protein for Xklp2
MNEGVRAKEEDEHLEFHSRSCPTKILEDVVSVPLKKVPRFTVTVTITVCKSLAFAPKQRARQRR